MSDLSVRQSLGSIEGLGSWSRTSENRNDLTSKVGQGPEALIEHSRLPAEQAGQSTESFLDMLKAGMDKTNAAIQEADHATKQLIAGRSKNIHETMLLMEKADMTYKMALQVRNKIIDAYREVMKMQV